MTVDDLRRLAQEVELSDNEEDLKEYYKKWLLIKENAERTRLPQRDEESLTPTLQSLRDSDTEDLSVDTSRLTY